MLPPGNGIISQFACLTSQAKNGCDLAEFRLPGPTHASPLPRRSNPPPLMRGVARSQNDATQLIVTFDSSICKSWHCQIWRNRDEKSPFGANGWLPTADRAPLSRALNCESCIAAAVWLITARGFFLKWEVVCL